MGADESVRNASLAYSSVNAQPYRSQGARVDLAPIVTLTSVLTETVHPTWVFTEVVTPPGETTTVYATPQNSLFTSREETFSSQHSTTEDQMSSGAESIFPASTPSTNVPSPTDSSASSPSTSLTSAFTTPMSSQVQGLATPFASPASAQSSESSALYINPWLLTSTTSSTTSSSTSSSTTTSSTTTSSTTTSSTTSDLTTSLTSTTSTSSEIPATSSSSTSSTISSSSDLSILPAAQSSMAVMASVTTASSRASSIEPSVYAGETPISNSLSLSHVTSQTSSSPTSLLPGVIAGSATSVAESSGDHINTKAIVGGTLGGAAFATISILALVLFFRRRRQRKPQGQPTNDNQRILSNDSITSFHNRHSSQPILSLNKELSVAPLNFPRRYSNPPVPRWNAVPLGGPNTNPFRDSLHIGDEEKNIPENPFAHPEDDNLPQISPPIPTSRSVSNYSRLTGGGHKSSMSYDSRLRSSRHQSSHYSGDSTLNLPDVDSPSFKYPITPKRRSDPFDLEPPPAAAQKPSPRSFWRFNG